jgi:biopolymer transport protein ExbD/biopolymer transport protein TolR
MAFGRLERSRAAAPMSEINMTPLIDVMLVLLVIFMITAPLMASSLKLDLPKAQGATSSESPALLSLSVDPKGQFYLADEALADETLLARARQSAQENPATEVQLRADAAVPYGRVAQLIGLLQAAGLSRIGFVTAPGEAASPAATPTAP